MIICKPVGASRRLRVLRRSAGLAGCLCLTAQVAAAQQEAELANDPAAAAAVRPLLEALGPSTDPGCVVGAEVNGRPILIQGHGMALMDQGIPLTARSVLQTGSIAKQVTAFAVLLLAERGALSLDDPLSRHLPRFDFGRPVTLRQLLQHTSGIRDQDALLTFAGWRGDDPVTVDDVLALLERQKGLGFEPGARHVYSNSGYILLGAVVEKVSGVSLPDFAQREIFAPLGMNDTRLVSDYMLVIPRRATGYLPRIEGGWAAVPSTLGTAGSSNLFTTVPDMLRWTTNLHSPHVGAGAVRMMGQAGLLSNGESTGYGGGLYISRYRGMPALLHGGAVRGFIAELLVVPEARFGAVAFCNRWNVDAGGMVRRLAGTVVPAAPAPRPAPSTQGEAVRPGTLPAAAPSALPGALPGIYRHTVTGALRHVAVADGQAVWGPSRVRLMPAGNGLFDFGPGLGVMRWTPATATRGALFEVLDNGMASATYERLPDFIPERHRLADYAGEYRSAELDATYVVTVAENGLDVAGPRFLRARASPLYRDGFQLDLADGILEFRRDRRGRITGFDLGTERTPGVRFARRERRR